MSASMQLRAVTEKLTGCRIKPSGSCQYPCSSERSRRLSQAVKSSHRAHISIHAAQSGHGETHTLSNQAIGLMSVSMQLGAVTEKLTSCRIKPSGSCQYPCSSERSRRNSRAVESSHRAHISIHAALSGHGETHPLSNQAIELISVSMQLRAVTEKLTSCRIKPSGSCQYPCSSERSRRNSPAVESSHRAHVTIHAARGGHGETHPLSNHGIGLMSVSMRLRAVTEKLTRCRIKPSGSCQYPCSSERSRRNSRAVESSHRAHVSIHAARSGHGETH